RQDLAIQSGLERQLESERTRFAELDRNSSEEIAGLNEDVENLRRELAAAQSAAEELEADPRGQIINRNADLAARGDDIDPAQRLLEREGAERAHVQANLADARERIAVLEKKLEDTESKLASADQELGDARETLAIREGRLTEMMEARER